jgi:hypothetical protein
MRRLVLCIVLACTAAPVLADPPPPLPVVTGRSGFWTSRMPAKGGAYRYRLMGIGGGLLLGTGLFVRRLIKRANEERDKRNKK